MALLTWFFKQFTKKKVPIKIKKHPKKSLGKQIFKKCRSVDLVIIHSMKLQIGIRDSKY